MCDHSNARCVESTDPKAEGRFVEQYECPCGATGTITGLEQEQPSNWDRYGEVFA